MGQRQATQEQTSSPFKYASIEACEMAEDFHVVAPTVWPPKAKGRQTDEPTVSLQCQLCGGWVIVEAGHAKGEIPGVRVILPQIARSA